MRSSVRLNGARCAFTLLEMTVAILIAMLVIGAAALSLKGIDGERKIRRVASDLEINARTAMREALVRRQAQCILLAGDGFTVAAPEGRSVWKRLPRGGSLEVRRWGETKWREPRAGEAWWFRPGLPCEPLSIRVRLPQGRYEMSFDPLTAIVADEGLAVNP